MTTKTKDQSVSEVFGGIWRWYIKGNSIQKIWWIIFVTIILYGFFMFSKKQFTTLSLLFIPFIFIDGYLGKRK